MYKYIYMYIIPRHTDAAGNSLCCRQRVPIAEDGAVKVGHGAAETTVRIERLHLEHDSGKSIHTLSTQFSAVDLNRAGTGLMEMVTGPDIRSGAEAAAFVQQILLILRRLGTCDGNMAEGSVRVDANVSVRPLPAVGDLDSELGVRCEVKNISGRDRTLFFFSFFFFILGCQGCRILQLSFCFFDLRCREIAPRVACLPANPLDIRWHELIFCDNVVRTLKGLRFLSKAIDFERQRQVAILKAGGIVEAETRNYDVAKGTTVRIRGKEDEVDYR